MSDFHHEAIIELKERLPRLDYNIGRLTEIEVAEQYYQRIGVVFGKARKKYNELKEQSDVVLRDNA